MPAVDPDWRGCAVPVGCIHRTAVRHVYVFITLGAQRGVYEAGGSGGAGPRNPSDLSDKPVGMNIPVDPRRV